MPKKKIDDSFPDSLMFQFDKSLNDIPYSFSKELEKKKKRKVVKIIGVFNPVKNSIYKAEKQGRIMLFNIERIPISNGKEEMQYFTCFEKYYDLFKNEM